MPRSGGLKIRKARKIWALLNSTKPTKELKNATARRSEYDASFGPSSVASGAVAPPPATAQQRPPSVSRFATSMPAKHPHGDRVNTSPTAPTRHWATHHKNQLAP